MQWLQTSAPAPDVLILVETRMAHDMEHMAQSYYVMHSSKPHAGIMILIHKRMAPQHRVTWRILSTGRLVHARLYGSNNSHINIIGYYQQAWQTQQAATCLKRRAELTTQLDQLLQSCSKCQLLLLGGDFNTDLPPAPPYIGEAQALGLAKDGPRQADRRHLQAHDMCALNTFRRWTPTYRGPGPNGDLVQSRIDYLFMRHKHANMTMSSSLLLIVIMLSILL